MDFGTHRGPETNPPVIDFANRGKAEVDPVWKSAVGGNGGTQSFFGKKM
jgi:hypothetical protein